jgi:hypothetical protein
MADCVVEIWRQLNGQMFQAGVSGPSFRDELELEIGSDHLTYSAKDPQSKDVLLCWSMTLNSCTLLEYAVDPLQLTAAYGGMTCQASIYLKISL